MLLARLKAVGRSGPVRARKGNRGFQGSGTP